MTILSIWDNSTVNSVSAMMGCKLTGQRGKSDSLNQTYCQNKNTMKNVK